MALSISEVAARRYATALLDVARDTGLGDRCVADLERFVQAVSARPDVKDLFDNPTIPVESVRKVVSEIAAKMGINQISASFLAILASRRRLSGIERIVAQYRREQDERAGRARGEIRSAGPISPTQVETIRTAVGARLGKQLILTQKRDPSLLGGLQVTVGDRVYDLSARTYLNSLRSRLLQNR